MSAKKDMTGLRFGRLVVLCEDGRTEDRKVKWKCQCDCGNIVSVSGKSLRSGNTLSCGCLRDEKNSELHTKHGLKKSNTRLYNSVLFHFQKIRMGGRGYQNWTLDARYTDNAEGAVRFCRDLLALQPEACARYEMDKSLDLDKDNDTENLFRPESIVFRPASENRSKHYNNLKLDDGCLLFIFCRQVGIETIGENGKTSKQYKRISEMYRKRNKAHPELIAKANEVVALYKKTLKLLKLREEVRQLKADVETLSQMSR